MLFSDLKLPVLLLILGIPYLVDGQEGWVPEKLEDRFHKGEGRPWFTRDGRPDSLDIQHYDIELERMAADEKKLKGRCRIEAKVLQGGIETFPFDLAGFKVDKVRSGDKSLPYQREGDTLRVRFPEDLNKGEKLRLTVAYRGEPVKDPSGWGGIYFQKGYTFNMGVGFKAEPHSYGRTWFPCVDHFRERASYSFKVLAPEGEKAVCSGSLQEVENVEGGRRYHWELKKEVPPYLVSFAIGDYATLRWKYESESGERIPIRLDVAPSDSADAVRSFAHLKEALSVFEERFGPYRWPRVGYVSVPFIPNSAMEHATNIAFPHANVNGTHRSDDLMAHELAHAWWGNLLTCATPWDMWINEGMASFSEFLFREGYEGEEAYMEAVKANHKKVLRSAHLSDGNEFRAVYGTPHRFTYGAHVYDKGADVVRSFRYMLGDSLFFEPLKRILEENRYSNMNSERLGSLWQRFSERPVESYFEDWLLRPGFPHFRVHSYKVDQQKERFKVAFKLEQRMTHASEPYRFVPVEILLRGADGRQKVVEVESSQEMESFTATTAFRPVHITADPGGKLAQATITDTATIKSSTISKGGVHSFEHTDAKLNAGDLPKPFHIHLRQHFIEADLGKELREQYHISKARFWSVGGTYSSKSNMQAVFRIDGQQKKGTHPEIHFFDAYERIDEEELFVLHRAPNDDDWDRCSSCEIQPRGSSEDGKARILIREGLKGDFVLAGPLPE